MVASTHEIAIPADMARRHFWLYVCSVTSNEGNEFLYVGRTGSTSRLEPGFLMARLGQHLQTSDSSDLVGNMRRCGIDPQTCGDFKIVAHGPLFPATSDENELSMQKSITAALERALCDALTRGKYRMLNQETEKPPLCWRCWQDVHQAFKEKFAEIALYPAGREVRDYPCYRHS